MGAGISTWRRVSGGEHRGAFVTGWQTQALGRALVVIYGHSLGLRVRALPNDLQAKVALSLVLVVFGNGMQGGAEDGVDGLGQQTGHAALKEHHVLAGNLIGHPLVQLLAICGIASGNTLGADGVGQDAGVVVAEAQSQVELGIADLLTGLLVNPRLLLAHAGHVGHDGNAAATCGNFHIV